MLSPHRGVCHTVKSVSTCPRPEGRPRSPKTTLVSRGAGAAIPKKATAPFPVGESDVGFLCSEGESAASAARREVRWVGADQILEWCSRNDRLTMEKILNRDFIRLQQITHLLKNKNINNELRWTT